MIRSLLFTREQPIEKSIQKQIESQGLKWQQIPLISLCLSPEIPKLSLSSKYDWVFFTSSASVRFFYQAYGEVPSESSLAVIGSKTFEALREEDRLRGEYPTVFTSEIFLEQWLAKQKTIQRVLFPQSDLSRKLIQGKLREAGHLVDDFVLYHNGFLQERQCQLKKWMLTEPAETMVIFASPSAWQHFYRYYQHNPFEVAFASIGPVTTKAIKKDGYQVRYEAPECTMVSLVKELLKGERYSTREF
ncbi:uroporphyrinogen-III synthase [uncultured Vagococcus sp.]|uniref:uroporphyrinogen-III synthase n=1 Tax=uncultured Vagococcus sp. TaxID=189676 RepID=UPI0028D51F88|nr:uroporphyrinogen-III synthase [uncultured Vagococcus sp.]